MFEKFDIDYVLLEAHEEIECPGGAGIGIMPNGCFLLDQLGLYEAIRLAAGDGEVETSYIRDAKGKPVITLQHMMYHQEKRHGYPMLFFDRKSFLKTLHDQLKHKSRIRLSKRVQRVVQTPSGVEVHTTDNATPIKGTILLGTDGVHSTVRNQMRQLAPPSYFPADEEEKVPCYYKCSFGIAQHVEGWTAGEQGFTTGDGKSFLVVSGPNGRCYWFLFVRLPDVKRGKQIPRYTAEDEAAFVRENRKLKIKENLEFGQVYAKRISSALTPLHETVYQKWFYGRILLVGDSVHKPNPIGGMGANAAMETSAELINVLLDLKKSRANGLNGLSNDEIKGVFDKVQETRFARANRTIAASHELQALNAYEVPMLSSLVWKVLVPLAGSHNFFRELSAGIVGASRLKYLPLPARSRTLPYDHELPAKPLSKSSKRIAWSLFSMTMLFLIYTASSAMNVTFEELQSWGTVAPLKRNWLGGGTVPNAILNVLTSLISFPVLDQGLAPRVHLIYFLTHMLSPLLIYTVEGYRIGRHGTLLSLPVIFMFGMQLQGICKFAPLYALLSAAHAEQNPVDRAVRTTVAKVLVPALVLGFLIPTALMFGPTPDQSRWQDWVALFQWTPPIFSFLVAVFSSGLSLWSRITKGRPEDANKHPEWYSTADVPILKSAYTVVFAVQATVHLTTLAYAITHPDLSMAAVFFQLPHPFNLDWNLSIAEKVFAILRYDVLLTHVAIALHNLYTVWELRGQGYVTTMAAVQAAGLVILGQVFVGSGATWAGLWSWREDVICGVSVDGEKSRKN
ncbi:FAD binding domain [Lecanosticta acicola]|uniref:FAD binding domain n=1 Tax=Lecanosticta acicola TaxID=111012 RepID=A0AAI9EDB1_9PEZI|nr:FAD binding domain [Lecanosticta acicola]